MKLRSIIFLIWSLLSLSASATVSYEVKIELVQPGEAARSLVLGYSSSKCQIEFKGKIKKMKSQTCKALFNKYETALKKEDVIFDEVGSDSPFYRLTIQKDGKKWSLKTNVSDHQLCDLKNKCNAVSGTEIRKFISEVNSLIN